MPSAPTEQAPSPQSDRLTPHHPATTLSGSVLFAVSSMERLERDWDRSARVIAEVDISTKQTQECVVFNARVHFSWVRLNPDFGRAPEVGRRESTRRLHPE